MYLAIYLGVSKVPFNLLKLVLAFLYDCHLFVEFYSVADSDKWYAMDHFCVAYPVVNSRVALVCISSFLRMCSLFVFFSKLITININIKCG